MTTDTAPATATPEGLAAALALIDVDAATDAAVARLCALATGAKAGEGAVDV